MNSSEGKEDNKKLGTEDHLKRYARGIRQNPLCRLSWGPPFCLQAKRAGNCLGFLEEILGILRIFQAFFGFNHD